MKNKKILLVLLFCLSLSACSLWGSKKEATVPGEENIPQLDQNGEAVIFYTLEEVAKHKTSDDCWTLIKDGVYNLSDFARSHPGDRAAYEACGIDGTNLFETRPMGSNTPHSDKAEAMLELYKIGELKK